MSIDTAAKRLAVLGYEEIWAEAMPFPGGSTSIEDRAILLWGYYIRSGGEFRIYHVESESRVYTVPE